MRAQSRWTRAKRAMSLPKTRFWRNHAHLSRRIPSRGVPPQPGRGMGLTISTEAVERLALRK
jgi:hypothetical protein